MNFTDDEIRIKVAEAMGFRAEKWESGGWMLYRENQRLHHPLDGTVYRESCFYRHTPNYPLDLNACAEFEATLTDEEKASYVMWLNASHPTSDIFYPDQAERGFNNKLAGEVFGLVSATARQRCLAYLKTKGLIP